MRMNKEIVMVRLSDIIPNRFQPRLAFDEEALDELATSIKEHGIIQPLILRDLGNKYEIIAGERRYKASQLAGVLEVPAIIGYMDDQTSAELALIENIQRKDLTAIEEAKSYRKILEMGGFTQEELAKRMGKAQSTIANKMRLLTLTNEVQMALMNNLISERHARCLLQLKDEEKQKEVLNKIINERMNVRDTDNYIKGLLGNTNNETNEMESGQEVAPSMPEPVISNEPNSLPEGGKLEEQNVEQIGVLKEEPAVEPQKQEPIPENKPEETEKEANPNVYTQTDNIDFIDINSLTDDNLQKDSSEKKEDDEMLNTNTVTEEANSVEINDISKIKMATAIALAKDALEEIKKAGYQAVLEEVDNQNSYQIVINIEK